MYKYEKLVRVPRSGGNKGGSAFLIQVLRIDAAVACQIHIVSVCDYARVPTVYVVRHDPSLCREHLAPIHDAAGFHTGVRRADCARWPQAELLAASDTTAIGGFIGRARHGAVDHRPIVAALDARPSRDLHSLGYHHAHRMLLALTPLLERSPLTPVI